jgi:hypothetical protein
MGHDNLSLSVMATTAATRTCSASARPCNPGWAEMHTDARLAFTNGATAAATMLTVSRLMRLRDNTR